MQRFLDPKGLVDRGIEHFDAWAATFGEVVDAMEISPDGASLRSRSRFAKFTNLPELQQMFRSFSDVQTAEMLDLPRPLLQGGKAQVVACPMSEEQSVIQKSLVARYERIRSQKVDPREDNALAITTDGRKLALDARLLSPTVADHAGSKVNALVELVGDIWRTTGPSRGTQLVFCDMGVHRTVWGFSVYETVIAKLTGLGIPRDEIAAIGDADSDAKKQSLFDKVRHGGVRVLIGSTQKMGTGTNVQQRLIALHHLDAPWKPAEVEQREGRILRQGNSNAAVSIYRYVTEGSFDAYMWQALETKARFIVQVITGQSAGRKAEDIGGQEMSYAEVKAIASGNPAVLTLAEADAEIQRLSILKRNHTDEQYIARRNLKELPGNIERMKKRLAALTADRDTINRHPSDSLLIGARACRREQIVEVLSEKLKLLPAAVREPRRDKLGVYRGLEFGLVLCPLTSPEVFLEGAISRQTALSPEHRGPRAIFNAVERLAESYEEENIRLQAELALAERQFVDYQSRTDAGFSDEGYMVEMTRLRNELKTGLSHDMCNSSLDPVTTVNELAEQIKQLRAQRHTDAMPRRNNAIDELSGFRRDRIGKRRRGNQPRQHEVDDFLQHPSPSPSMALTPQRCSPENDPDTSSHSKATLIETSRDNPPRESLRERLIKDQCHFSRQLALFDFA